MTEEEDQFCSARIFPDRPERDFATISRYLLQDKEISADAQMVATFLLSLPEFKKNGEPWDINPSHIWRSKNIGRNRVYNAINELCTLGYMKKSQGKNGNLNAGYTYQISSFKKFVRHPQFRDAETGDAEIGDFKKKQEKKEIKENNNPIPEPQKIEPQKTPSAVVVSFKEKTLERTKLTVAQQMKIKTKFSHLGDDVFLQAIEAFFDYEKKHDVANYFATLSSALGAGGEPWTRGTSHGEIKDKKEVERKKKEDTLFWREERVKQLKRKYETNKYFTIKTGHIVTFEIGYVFFEYKFYDMFKCNRIIYDSENFDKEVDALEREIEKRVKDGNY